ncbi:MAG: oligosaccharide flippase family protein [Candidatus Pacearchaeota archaeon]
MKERRNQYDLIKSGTIFFIGAMLVAILNYLYHLFMGRMLGPIEYGVLGSVFALVYIATTATGAFNLIISKFTAEFHGKEQQGQIKYLVTHGLKKTLIYGVILLAVYILLTPIIANFMNLKTTSGLIIVGVIAFVCVFSTILTGALNGFQKFIWQNTSSVLNAIVKFSLAVVLVMIGFGVNGALLAVLAGACLGILVCSVPLNKTFQHIKTKPFNPKKFYSHIVPIFVGFILPILIITLDQILVKHFMSSADAGFYAAAGMIAKTIWFGSGFLVGPLFPMIVNLKTKNKPTSYLLRHATVYTAIIASLGIICFFVIPTFIVNILYGSEYLEIVPLIGLFGVALGFYSVNNVFVIYNLATEKYRFIIIWILALIIEITGIIMFHNSLLDIVKIVFATNLFILISMIILNKNDLGLNGLNWKEKRSDRGMNV